MSGLDNNLTKLYNQYLTSSCDQDFTYKETLKQNLLETKSNYSLCVKRMYFIYLVIVEFLQ